jgi:hypothetical protein
VSAWPEILGTLPGWITAGGTMTALGLIIKAQIANRKMSLDHLRVKRKATDDVALTLVGRLETRVLKLEGDIEHERDRCEALLGVHRHKIRNQRTIIYALLHLFDMPAARRKEALVRVRADLAVMEQAEAQEGAIIAAAPLSRKAEE